MIHHIAPHRHGHIICPRLRHFRRHAGKHFSRQVQPKSIRHRLFDPVGRIGGSGHSVDPLQSVGVCIRKAEKPPGNPLDGRGKLRLIDLRVSAAEIIARDLDIRDLPVCHRHCDVNIIFSELIDMKSAALRIGTRRLLRRSFLRPDILYRRSRGQDSRQSP